MGNKREAINGGKPWVANLPFKLIAFLVNTISAAFAVGFSITSKEVAKPSK